MADWSAKMSRIEEASRRKDEINNEFKTQAKKALSIRMDQHVEKREAIMSDIKEKLKVPSRFKVLDKGTEPETNCNCSLFRPFGLCSNL